MIWAIDPGTTQSAYVSLAPNMRPVRFDKIDNAELLQVIMRYVAPGDRVVIEQVENYDNAVGKAVFETVRWAGRFEERADSGGAQVSLMPRRAVKLHICENPRAKDANIIQALKDRFGDKGTKREPGWFYGFKADVWQAYALAVTFAESEEV